MNVIVDPTIKAISESVFTSVAEAISTSGKKIVFGKPIPGLGKRAYRKCKEFNEAPLLSEQFSDETKLLIMWWSKVSHKFIKSLNTPSIILYKGILPDTWLADVGLLGESVLTKMLPGSLENHMDKGCQKWAKEYASAIVSSNKSKREQPSSRPNLPDKFIFLPMQYTDDISIKNHCSVPYSVFFKKVSLFCASKNISLVVKHHPDIVVKKNRRISKQARQWRNAELKKVGGLIERCRAKHGSNIIVADGSIHWLCQKCIFMAGMNTAAHIDAIMNQCISFHTGKSAFMNSNAVVHDEDIDRGLNKCWDLSSEEKDRVYKYQKSFLYYLYNRYSIIKTENDLYFSEWNNTQKIKNLISHLEDKK